MSGVFKLYGIRNHQAKNNISKMQPGDESLFYHEPSGKQIFGITNVVKSAYPDPTTNAPGWLAIDFEPIKTFAVPLTLDQIKAEPTLQGIGLIKQPRLSVMRLAKNEFEKIINLANLKS
jgi:predicted RNA-binding protein with PUA-like domain